MSLAEMDRGFGQNELQSRPHRCLQKMTGQQAEVAAAELAMDMDCRGAVGPERNIARQRGDLHLLGIVAPDMAGWTWRRHSACSPMERGAPAQTAQTAQKHQADAPGLSTRTAVLAGIQVIGHRGLMKNCANSSR